MIYSTPRIKPDLQAELERLDETRDKLSIKVDRKVPWIGSLRRFERGDSYGSSVEIEGFSVNPHRIGPLVSGSSPASEEDEQALFYYAMAMDHVAALASEENFEWSSRLILDLHFEACRFQADRHPGSYRRTAIGVTAPGGGIAFHGPPSCDVPGLCEELVEFLNQQGDTHVVVAAAMAHLSLVSIHPFDDGNGRISRIIQSLVLARQQILLPEFGSIEPYLAGNTGAYYDALAQVQQGEFSPSNDATLWVEFCVKAHRNQAERRLRLIDAAAERWSALEELAEREGWPSRLIIALEQALAGGTDRARYGREAEVSPASASNDLRRLVDGGYLEQSGKGRSTSYLPSPQLRRSARASST